jgi:hypothetical protein
MGKLALFVVLAFSSMFLIMSYNANNAATRTVDNMVNYHTISVAHNIASSGTNIAANEIFLDNNWADGFSDVDFADGYFDATVTIIDPFMNIRKLTTVGHYRGSTKQIDVILKPSSFSKFAYYSEDEGGIHWHDGDTVWGPWHSQDNIRVNNSPVFYGKVTTKGTILYDHGPGIDDPKFYGGIETGIDVPMPAAPIVDLEAMAIDNGAYMTGEDTVYLTFESDSVKYRTSYNSPDTAYHLSTIAPNGILYTHNSILRVKGTIKGQYTVASNKTIFIDDDIVYQTDPRTNPNSTDIFGIVSDQDVFVADNPANHNDINLHASIFCKVGGFGAENPGGRPNSGSLRLFGGMQQHQRKLVSNPWPTHGFLKNYTYDERLMFASPPGYPGTGKLEIVSWFE